MKWRGRGGGTLEIEMYERENQSVMLGPIGGCFKFDSIDFHLVHDDQIKVIVRGSIKCYFQPFQKIQM